MSREYRHESTRIGVHSCSWKRHTAFSDDIGRLAIDVDTWVALKTAMRRLGQGTVRVEEWEFPCASSSGMLGELKHYEQDEVSFVTPVGQKQTESTEVHYRIYFNEPTLCPQELWAMGAGAKSHHPEYGSTDQDLDISVAVVRTGTTSLTGSELVTFAP